MDPPAVGRATLHSRARPDLPRIAAQALRPSVFVTNLVSTYAACLTAHGRTTDWLFTLVLYLSSMTATYVRVRDSTLRTAASTSPFALLSCFVDLSTIVL